MDSIVKSHGKKRFLIINADDYGIGIARDKGIIEGFRKGKISSVSAIVNSEISKSELSIAQLEGFSLGLHLNLTEGTPLTLCKYLVNERNEDKIPENELRFEIIAQIEKFISAFKKLPTHVDGHQHVHVIPKVANTLAFIMASLFGIYRVRIPIERLEKETNPFYFEVNEDAKISKQIFEKKCISSTDEFIGMNLMNERFTLENLKTQISNCDSKTMELMCHPGFPGNEWDEFNKSERRLEELNLLLSNELERFLEEKNIQKITFTQLVNRKKLLNKPRILILSVLTQSSGNLSTCLRLKAIFQSKFEVFIRNNSLPIDFETELDSIRNFIEVNRIDILLGIHAFRSGKFMNQISSIPKIVILAGTDMNTFLNEQSKIETIKNSIEQADEIVAFNDFLKSKALSITTKTIHLVPQSVDVREVSEKANVNIPQGKIILLPASLRKVKDVTFCFHSLAILLQKYEELHFWLLGNILDNEYGDEIFREIEYISNEYGLKGRFAFKGFFKREDYLHILSQSFLLINTSISEGMSCSILEAMAMGIPVLARNIEGNRSLIVEGVNGLLFNDNAEFLSKFETIFVNKEFRDSMIANSKNLIETKFSLEIERETYHKILSNLLEKNFYNYEGLMIYQPNHIHQTSKENTQLFEQVKIPEKRDKMRVLDLGCGSGIFSFVVLMKNGFHSIEITFSDFDQNALKVCKGNFGRFQDVVDFNCEANFVFSDMYQNISKDEKFDLVLINMPQMPGHSAFRS